MTYHQEQCACGFVARVPEGELKPDGWHRLWSGRLMCPRCFDAPTNLKTQDDDRSRERALGEGT